MTIDTCRDTEFAHEHHLPAWCKEAFEQGFCPHELNKDGRAILAEMAAALDVTLSGDPRFHGLTEEDTLAIHPATGRLVLYVVGAGYAWQDI